MWPIVRHFLRYNRRYGAQYYPYLASNTLRILVNGIIIPLYIRQFIDTLVSAEGSDPQILSLLYGLLVAIALWSVAYVFTNVAADYFITQVGPRIMRDIENDCFAVIHRLPLQFFAGTQVGGLVAKVKRFANGYNTLDLHLSRGVLESFVLLVSTVIVVSFFSPLLSFAFIAWGVVYLVALLAAIRLKLRLDVERTQADSRATGFLADSITNALVVKIFSRLPDEIAEFAKRTEAVARAQIRSWYASTAIGALQVTLISTISVGILFLSLRLWQQGTISVGTIVLVQTYVFIVGGHFFQLGEQFKAIYRAVADCSEMMEILQIQPAVTDPAKPRKPMMEKGSIAMDAVTFGYDARLPVFENFSLEIPAGQRVGVVGHSGTGKSTLIALLMRFMDIREGAITIDGQDIRSLTQDDLRRHMSYVPQDPLLFHRSIRENILYGKPEATEKEMIAAATKAHAHEFISQLPSGYETIVGERGIKLSGGERQRIAIARAMLRDAPILILDEATSSLDSVSEHYIQQAFDTLVHNRTTVVIAHRLSTIQKMDRIIVLEEGLIAEDGPHEKLLKQKGIYAELWRHQSDGFLGA